MYIKISVFLSSGVEGTQNPKMLFLYITFSVKSLSINAKVTSKPVSAKNGISFNHSQF